MLLVTSSGALIAGRQASVRLLYLLSIISLTILRFILVYVHKSLVYPISILLYQVQTSCQINYILSQNRNDEPVYQ